MYWDNSINHIWSKESMFWVCKTWSFHARSFASHPNDHKTNKYDHCFQNVLFSHHFDSLFFLFDVIIWLFYHLLYWIHTVIGQINGCNCIRIACCILNDPIIKLGSSNDKFWHIGPIKCCFGEDKQILVPNSLPIIDTYNGSIPIRTRSLYLFHK